MVRYLSLLAGFLIGLPLLSAEAQDIGAGEKLAKRWCSECHHVGPDAARFGFAPAFSRIARAKGVTETSIQVFLITPHHTMPNYVLSRDEIRDVAAYIVSLRSTTR